MPQCRHLDDDRMPHAQCIEAVTGDDQTNDSCMRLSVAGLRSLDEAKVKTSKLQP